MNHRSAPGNNASGNVTNRRSFIKSITAASLGLIASSTLLRANKAAAWGEIGYISTQGAELFVHPTNLSPILYMDQGVAVDILFGPYQGLYEVRYYDTDGWVWEEYVSFSGQEAVANTETYEYAEAPAQASGEKWIEVNRSTRTVTLHNGDIIVAEFDALIGKDLSPDGYYSTAVGTFHIWVMEPALAETPFAEGVYLTHFVGFDPDRSNGFHSPTRDASGNILHTGGQQTLGCVRLSEEDAMTLFDFAEIGMRVEVHD